MLWGGTMIENEPYPWRTHLACALPALAIIAALWLTFGGERQAEAFFAAFRPQHPVLTAMLRIVTDWGNYALYSPYAFILARGIAGKNRRLFRFVCCFIIAFAATLLVVYVFKGMIGRTRPYLNQGFSPWSWTNHFHSFPSGHTTEAVAATVPAAMLSRDKRIAVGLGLAAALIAFTRVYLGAHYPADLLGGVVMGSVCAWLTWRLFRKKSDGISK